MQHGYITATLCQKQCFAIATCLSWSRRPKETLELRRLNGKGAYGKGETLNHGLLHCCQTIHCNESMVHDAYCPTNIWSRTRTLKTSFQKGPVSSSSAIVFGEMLICQDRRACGNAPAESALLAAK